MRLVVVLIGPLKDHNGSHWAIVIVIIVRKKIGPYETFEMEERKKSFSEKSSPTT